MEINLVIKVQQFEDKRIAAKASWNIKELKGKLSEIYPTSTEEQKLIYSGKLLNDTVVLKDVLREYEGQEAHTVHLVFTPKTLPPLSRSYKEQQQKALPVIQSNTSSDMNSSELRQRNTAATTATSSSSSNDNRPPTNIPNNYYNPFYASGMPDQNSLVAQQYAMQTWMQQAYAQYINQYMNIMASPDALQQQQQQAQLMSNLAFMQPQMPFISPTTASVAPIPSTSSQSDTASSANQEVPQPQPPQQPAVEPQQRRFPNIIQDEQENRDWLDILYSMSRLLILLCLVYFYSSPLRCCIVILIGVSIYLYHLYRQNQNRLNNNNSIRVNLNNVNNRPAAVAPQAADDPSQEQQPQNENLENPNEENPLLTSTTENEVTTQTYVEPQVPVLDIIKTFLVSFVASIIPSDPAI